MKPRVLVSHWTFPEALDILRDRLEVEGGLDRGGMTREKLLARVAEKDGLLTLVVDRIDREVMEAAPRLKMIANCAVGVDNIDLAAAAERGIFVSNTPGVLTEATADLTWALILAAARKVPQADSYAKEGRFQGWELDLFLGKDLAGRRLGLIGFGRIGQAVARRAAGFGMEIVYSDPERQPLAVEAALRASWLPLDDLLQTADVVSIHAALTPGTRHLLSAGRIALMKSDAILINAARGPIVDEPALAAALAEGKLWAAGLDVYEREPAIDPRLLQLDNVVLLPHIGSATRGTRLAMALTAARNLVQGLTGRRPENLVSGTR